MQYNMVFSRFHTMACSKHSALLQAGDFDLELLIGDKAIGTPVRWHLTTVTISYQANDDGPQSALLSATSTAEALQARFQPKPEIVHIQRAPGKSPPKAISLLFTGLTLLPLLVLFYTLQLAGANLKVSVKTAAAVEPVTTVIRLVSRGRQPLSHVYVPCYSYAYGPSLVRSQNYAEVT